MYSSSTSEGPAILQLHRWSPFLPQLNLSEYREAFISPTRQILLLHSYQCEALILPLSAGDSCKNNIFGSNYNVNYQKFGSLDSSRTPTSLEAEDNIEQTNQSGVDVAHQVSESSNFIGNVNSIAWGVCGDSGYEEKVNSFREYLFLCGDKGVTVHAFCHSTKNKSIDGSTQSEFEEGRWVEWGPATLAQDVEPLHPSSLHSEASENFVENGVSENGERSDFTGFSVKNEKVPSRCSTSKRWLKTFLSKTETIKLDGSFWTRYPGKSSFPSSARVVSFSILDSNFPFIDSLSNASSTFSEECSQEPFLHRPVNSSVNLTSLGDPNTDSDILSAILSGEANGLYRCYKVFSNRSHSLVGFALTIVDSVSEDKNYQIESNRSNTLLLVARLGSWGIQWVSSLKFAEIKNVLPSVECTDFCFSDDFLFCLTAPGLIFIYNALSSEYVTCINILQACGLKDQLNLMEHAKLLEGVVLEVEQNNDVFGNLTHEHRGFGIKRKFKRLLTSSHTSLLAVVDEFGIMYVITYNIPEKCLAPTEWLPDFQNMGLGTLAGWEVGGSDIGCQRIFFNSLSCHRHNFSSTKGVFDPLIVNFETKGLQKFPDTKLHGKQNKNDSGLSGFSANLLVKDHRFWDSKVRSVILRRVFMPIYRSSKDDCICFSPMGITQFLKKTNFGDQNYSQVVHLDLRGESKVYDDSLLNSPKVFVQARKEALVGDAVGCSFQGYLYLVTETGVSVVLPSVAVPMNFIPDESAIPKQICSPRMVEILDRVLLYEGIEEADRLCFENGLGSVVSGKRINDLKGGTVLFNALAMNVVYIPHEHVVFENIWKPNFLNIICYGWDLKLARIQWFRLSLHYLKFDEIERSLEKLVDVNLEEEGVLSLLFAGVHLIFCKVGNDNDISAASRLLALASSFATTMVRKYGLLQYEKYACRFQSYGKTQMLSLPPPFQEVPPKNRNAMRLREMAHFLEIIRNLQWRLSFKFKRLSQGLEGGELTSLEELPLSDDTPLLPMEVELEMPNQHELSFPVSELGLDGADNLALIPFGSGSHLNSDGMSRVSAPLQTEEIMDRKLISFENPKEMIARWKLDNLPLESVVRDALLSGRLPLAVLQLHIRHLRDLIADKEPRDTFSEVREIGRAIAYDLFLKGEIEVAVATLQRLGEDIESSLKQLLFGTLWRTLRVQIANELKKYGYLGPYDLKILDSVSLIERLYPSSSFWKTFVSRQRKYIEFQSSSISTGGNILDSLCLHLINNFTIECGEVHGAVLGSWTSATEILSTPEYDEANAHVGYWAAAASWLNLKTWDQRTTDRILLDQCFVMGAQVMWESQLEYQISHNNWEEVSKLLDLIPTHVLSDGTLQVSLDGLQLTTAVGFNRESKFYNEYLYSLEDLDTVSVDIPGVKILRFFDKIVCSRWLRTLVEKKLARRLIFLKEFWEGSSDLIPLLAHSGFITQSYETAFDDNCINSSSDVKISGSGGVFNAETEQALHKLLIHHCTHFNLPFLLDIFLDHHQLVMDNDSLLTVQEAAGDCQWARWLLLSRIRGREFEASLFNSRALITCNLVPHSNLSVLSMDEIIQTVDDIAEGGGEMAALATLMYGPVPIQNCLSSGGVNRHSRSSAQCTIENLRPALQQFPTLWRTLVVSSFEEDTISNFVHLKKKDALSEYLNWRDNIFFSSARDTSLLQMLPGWFPKALRRLIQLYVQGPLGWQLISGLPIGEALQQRNVEFFLNNDENAEINEISWEATIQKHIEELYDSPLEETGFGIEHHLHRGRPLSAFNHLLGVRLQKLKSAQPSAAVEQRHAQYDLQTLLAPPTTNDESLFTSIMQLAIINFENSMLVASCAILLELCGLSASMLRVDVAVLRRIYSFYKSEEINENIRQLSPKGSTFHSTSHVADKMESLARALADDYLHQVNTGKQKGPSNSVITKSPSLGCMLVLQHLEKASLPTMIEGNSCGSWLFHGNGDGSELRSQQKSASQYWNLVTLFCRTHELPLSQKYLALLARDNDWVGFLTEAHIGGHAFDTVIQVVSKEFCDQRLKIHILTVLKSMLLMKKASSLSQSDIVEKRSETFFSDESISGPVELFKILADCEKKEDPGQALLIKAKELSWSILAMVASCFPDVSALSCLIVWLEITAARETSSTSVNDFASQIAINVGLAVEATNTLPAGSRTLAFHYNRKNPKRRRHLEPLPEDSSTAKVSSELSSSVVAGTHFSGGISCEKEGKLEAADHSNVPSDSDKGSVALSKMVALLCEQKFFLPLLKAFEMFVPSSSLLPFIRALQAFSQMRLPEASAHLGSFSIRIKEEANHPQANMGGEGNIGTSWINTTAVKAADAVLSTCPSPYERRCLLQLLAATDFGDGGTTATHYRRLYWKINLAEPSLRKDDGLHLGNETLDDASLLAALEKNGHWEQARNWAKQLEASEGTWKSIVHHVTETQAESMVAEWKEFLWDVPEERVALWGHCQTLFIRHSFPPLQAGLFFLKHAEAVEKDLPAKELHELLLLSLQWLSGMITLSNAVYPLHLLREIETKVWLLAVESEAQAKNEGDLMVTNSNRESTINSSSIIDRTANIISKMDCHINTMRSKTVEKHDVRDYNATHGRSQVLDANFPTSAGGNAKTKRRAKGSLLPRKPLLDPVDKNTDSDDGYSSLNLRNDMQLIDENLRMETSFSGWEERVGPAELKRAVLSLFEFGQISAAKQLQHKLSPGKIPPEFLLVDAALKLAAISTPISKVSISMLDEDVRLVILSYNLLTDPHQVNPFQVLQNLATNFTEGNGRGLCKRLIAVVRAANVLGISFSEAFNKQPIELLQLLSLKAQDSFEEASLLVQTHSMPAAKIALILAESFLKGLLAAHRGGYMESQREEGPAPLLWRFSDFLKWSELCPSEPEIGHALMRLVITGYDIPHACEVELLILTHHFYKLSACLDGVDVLVALAATRVEAYVSEGDFPCLARLMIGVGNFHALNFILAILIENGQLDLLLQKYSAAADTNTSSSEAVRGFRMAVLTSLKHFNPNDLDAFAMVYGHFDMKHETATLLESRAEQSCELWFRRYDKDQNEDLLDAMRYFIEAGEVHSSIDAGNKTCKACAQASLVSLQIRMPDFQWLYLAETNARRALVDQSRFQEALIVSEAYDLNQPSEWALVLWNQMLKPELLEEFVAEFVAVLPLHATMLVDIAKFYRAEVAARGDQSQFSVWLTGGGLPAEWAKYLARSFRCLLRRTRDLRLRVQLASTATGFEDVIDACQKTLDKVPENAGPLILKKGHGGAYRPLM